jgi:hypothetical protein
MADFDEFLIHEYENIADAHFETGKQVSTFFNYYLLILAAPVVILTLVENKDIGKVVAAKDGADLLIHNFAILILYLIAFIGACISWIVIELQHDSILYARTVNGIRKHFYDKANLPPAVEEKIRVLPKKVGKPDFMSLGHLGVIVLAFASINTSFYLAGLYLYLRGNLSGWNWLLPIVVFLIHFVIYIGLSIKKKKDYPSS